MKPSDLTFLEGIVVFLHTIAATGYMILSYNIWQMKKYLRWNKHIYPTMMYGSIILAGSLFWLLSTYYFFFISPQIAVMMILILLGMIAIGYAVAAEATRLAHKYDKIQTLEQENAHLKSVIDMLKKNKILICLVLCFLLLNCGGLKKELHKFTEESKAKSELYQNEITKLNTKIKETEQRETETKTGLTKKETEISTLTKQRDELKETLDKMDKSDFVVKNPVGTVKVTDAKGNQYEFEGGAGTEISNKTESYLKSTLQRVAESLSEKTEKVKNLTQSIFTKDKTIKQKESEISALKEREQKTKSILKKSAEDLQKEKTKSGTHFGWWILLGIAIPVFAQLAWKAYKPKTI